MCKIMCHSLEIVMGLFAHKVTKQFSARADLFCKQEKQNISYWQ